MRKMYRMFISSTKSLLEDKRQELVDEILNSEHHPVIMEYGIREGNNTRSLEIDKERIDNSDCIIVVLSYLAGETVGSKVSDKEKCPLREKNITGCNDCHGKGCHLPFTQFEYWYAKSLGKPVFVLMNEILLKLEANSDYVDDAFEDKIEKLTLQSSKKKDYKNKYYSSKSDYKKFISEANDGVDKWELSLYDDNDEKNFTKTCKDVILRAIASIEKNDRSKQSGLLTFVEWYKQENPYPHPPHLEYKKDRGVIVNHGTENNEDKTGIHSDEYQIVLRDVTINNIFDAI